MLTRRFAQALLPLGLGFVLLIVSAVVAIWLSSRQETAVTWVSHTLEVESRLGLIGNLVTDAESGQRGYLLTGQRAYLEPYQRAVTRIPIELEALRQKTADNPRQQTSLEALGPAIQLKLNELGGSIALVDLGRRNDALSVVRTDDGRRYMLGIATILAGMSAEESRLLTVRTLDLGRFTFASRVALLLSAVLVVMLAFVAVRGATRRLLELEAVNGKLSEEKHQRRSAQSQVYQLQKMEAVGQLTGGIAHDFNNMLAVLIGSLDIAQRRLAANDWDKVAQCIDNAIEGAERAATLTARLLAFSRQQPLVPKILEINKLVGSTSEMLRRTLGERVEVETVLAGGLWRVSADSAQIESALVNLAVNARDAMPDGGKLTIETANCELDERYAATHEEVSAGQYVMLSVTDSGSGMPPEVRRRAFEPFYTTKEVGKGTGLGLSQIFGFIKQSKGHIEIYSEVDQGTTIKFYLPRHSGEERIKDQGGLIKSVPEGRAGEIILVVEDEVDVRRTTVDALRELGYGVLQASDGREALSQLAAQPRVDLLFTDVVMPGMTGRQLADRAAQGRPALKILYTTGYTRNAVVHNGVVDHDVSLLTKPFSIAALARKVRDVLDG